MCKLNGTRTDEGRLLLMEGLSGEHVSKLGLGDICLHDMCRAGARWAGIACWGQGAGVAGTGVYRIKSRLGRRRV